MLIPWQMFFLTPENLRHELERINELRRYKFSNRFFIKRKAAGDVTSKRIIDRLIRLQDYVVTNYDLPRHTFCGSLRTLRKESGAERLVNYFGIDIDRFRSKRFAPALDYLIQCVEER